MRWQTLWRLSALIVSCLAVTVLSTSNIGAAVPGVVHYQGWLTDPDGAPAADGIYTIAFSIWTHPTAGQELWNETHEDIETTGGLFSVLLGIPNELTPSIFGDSPDVAADSCERYLQIQIGQDPPIAPRIRMASAPYALVAHRLEGDVVTLKGKILVHSNSELLGGYGLSIIADADSSLVCMETTDGLNSTHARDKATPQLLTTIKKKKASATDSSYVLSQVDNTGILTIRERIDGSAATSRSERIENRLTEDISLNRYSSSDSSLAVTRIDSSGARMMLAAASGEAGGEIVNRLSAGTGGGPIGARIGGLACSENDTVAVELAAEGDSTRMLLTALGGGGQYLTGAIRLKTSEAALALAQHGPGGFDSILVNAGGSQTTGIRIHRAPSDEPSPAPQSNVEIYATDYGGGMSVANIGGADGDGYDWDCDAARNTVRIRHGGVNSGIYMEASSATGGRIGVNNETPGEALQVSGNICASGIIGVCSDVRFKRNIEAIRNPLGMLARLHGVTFEWKRDEFPDLQFAEGRQIGFVAQDVLPVLPEVVSRGSDGIYAVDYGKLAPLLVEAIKELQDQNGALRKRITDMERAIAELTARK